MSVREFYLIAEEEIVREMREQQRDLAMRSKFAKEKEPIVESRTLLYRSLYAEEIHEAEIEARMETAPAAMMAAVASMGEWGD